jgi:hypothetical protein
MKTELYKKVWIKSVDDLPKESGVYLSQITESCRGSFHFNPDDKDDIDFFMGNIEFYLIPLEQIEQPEQPEPSVQLSDEEIEKEVSTRGSEALFSVGDYSIGFIDGAKYARDQIKASLRNELMKCLEWLDDMQIIVLDETPENTVDEYLKTKNR